MITQFVTFRQKVTKNENVDGQSEIALPKTSSGGALSKFISISLVFEKGIKSMVGLALLYRFN